jgi:hypothetical protein
MLAGVCLLFVVAFFVPTAQAQETPPSPDTGCISCHDNLYYQHDTGNWFCQCAEQTSCTCCHGGNPEALTEKEAHTGMDRLPTQQNAESCQKCHPQDYQARIDQFSRTAGVSPYHPTPPTTGPVSESPTGNQLQADPASRLHEPWRLTGSILIGIAAIAIVVFGYRSRRADCTAKIKQ